ncbi:MAG: Rid family detoxifying hydrolase [Bacillota bacterium]
MIKGGPYSQAVEAGGFIFLSGVVPVHAAQGLSITDDIRAATALVLDNIKVILAEAGSSLDRAVKVTVFLRDMADFAAMNEVYVAYFTENRPARSCVAVRELPGNFPIEIELIALK